MANDFPRRRIAQEFCDIDQECVEQLIDFVGMGADVFRVGGVVAHIKLEHTPAEPALQGGLFVAGENRVYGVPRVLAEGRLT